MRRSLKRAMPVHSCAIWMASSRVGASTRARTLRSPAWMRSTTGTQKAQVLPVPVFARTSRSFPARAGSIIIAWTGVDMAYPRLSSPASTSDEMGKSANARSLT